jgi:aldose 1-epimerase
MITVVPAAPDRFPGKKVSVFTLKNNKGTEASITNYGAIILAFKIKKENGTMNDIVLGFDKPEDYLDEKYLAHYPYFGAAVGRYGNRIKDGKMRIDGTEYELAVNMGTDHIHGGKIGFDKKVWDVVSLDEAKNNVKLSIKSPDGEEGYPGNLDVSVTFELNEDNELSHEYIATTDKPTAINLTHHGYFNLDNGKGRVDDYYIKINASSVLEQDENLTTNGNFIPVHHTRFDFRQPHKMSSLWGILPGYDQSFVIDKKENELTLAAEAYSEESKTKLELLTTEPVVHFYTGIGLPVIYGKGNTLYGPYSGFCFETQVHPNAINIPSFPNTILRPGNTYRHKTVYRVSNINGKGN